MIQDHTKPHYVYRHLDADGRLLYVGVTTRPKERPYDSRRRPWLLTDTETVDVSGPMSREDAVREERATILAEEPVHNVRVHGSVEEDPEKAEIDRLVGLLGWRRADVRRTLMPMPAELREQTVTAFLGRRAS